jgi:transcriptional regulator with XRE-family HTH domain
MTSMSQELPTAFGRRLYRSRRGKGLTLRQVGDMLGVSAQSVAQWERGANLPRSDRLKKLANLYDVELDVLLSSSGPTDLTSLAEQSERLTQAVQTIQRPARSSHESRDLIRIAEIHEFDIGPSLRDLRGVPIIYEWKLPAHLFTHVTGDVRIVRVTSNAIAPLVEQNDYLLIDIDQRSIWGVRGIYILCDGQTVMIRRVAPVTPVDAGRPLRIYSPNRDIEECLVDESMLTVLGRVIGKFTMWL